MDLDTAPIANPTVDLDTLRRAKAALKEKNRILLQECEALLGIQRNLSNRTEESDPISSEAEARLSKCADKVLELLRAVKVNRVDPSEVAECFRELDDIDGILAETHLEQLKGSSLDLRGSLKLVLEMRSQPLDTDDTTDHNVERINKDVDVTRYIADGVKAKADASYEKINDVWCGLLTVYGICVAA